MAFTSDGTAPPGIPLLGCSPPTTMRNRTVFGGDLISLQKNKISTSSTDVHISYSKPPGYSLLSFPRLIHSSKSAEISSGGSTFLVRELAIVLNSSRHTLK